jgi:NAD(P)-dependent dehydrogenase (short-subunit alcohol dehydrogenase family)
MRADLSGFTAVVTGGANGIGLACANALAEAGAATWVFDPEKPPRHRHAAVDVTNAASIDAGFAASGAPDILIANAGIVRVAPMAETTDDDWRRTIDVNLSGVFRTLRAAARLMMPRRRGAIVVTASTNSFDGEASLVAYNASKAGVLGIVHTAANELGPYGIRVNAVCPGLIRTRLTRSYFDKPEVLKEYFRPIALGRGGETEEVANAVVFLASPLASYITGAALFVDGGQMAAKFGVWHEKIAVFEKDRWRLL